MSMRSPRCCIATIRATTGEWVPNKDGGRENYEAIGMLQRDERHRPTAKVAGIMTAAEESTSLSRGLAPR